jgi:hypothetical protein
VGEISYVGPRMPEIWYALYVYTTCLGSLKDKCGDHGTTCAGGIVTTGITLISTQINILSLVQC